MCCKHVGRGREGTAVACPAAAGILKAIAKRLFFFLLIYFLAFSSVSLMGFLYFILSFSRAVVFAPARSRAVQHTALAVA